MSRANSEQEVMRAKMVMAVDRLSRADVKAMLLRSINLATTFEMDEMAKATSFKTFELMDFDLDLTA